MKQTFEQYLQDIHAKNYHGTDDDMPEAFEAWVEDLGVDRLIVLADMYAELQYIQGRVSGIEEAKK